MLQIQNCIGRVHNATNTILLGYRKIVAIPSKEFCLSKAGFNNGLTEQDQKDSYVSKVFPKCFQSK
jgi:hypothetical protein